jgi:regulator of ribonuclease activity A
MTDPPCSPQSETNAITATSDIADVEGERVRSCDIQFRQFGGIHAFAGTVRTLQCHDDNAILKQVLSEAGDGCVLVIDGAGSLRTALVGDNMAARAIANGWSGLVIYGAIRDSREIASMPLGVKALGTSPRKSAKAGRGASDVPVEFGGVTFVPGDRLTSDSDGIVLLPANPTVTPEE